MNFIMKIKGRKKNEQFSQLWWKQVDEMSITCVSSYE